MEGNFKNYLFYTLDATCMHGLPLVCLTNHTCTTLLFLLGSIYDNFNINHDLKIIKNEETNDINSFCYLKVGLKEDAGR